jgi:hypothetical protein
MDIERYGETNTNMTIKGYAEKRMILLQHVDKGKLIKSILKASVDTIFSLTHCILHICLILLFRVNYAFQICENSEFGNLFKINSKIVYGPSITPKDDYFAKNCIKIRHKLRMFKFWNLASVVPSWLSFSLKP